MQIIERLLKDYDISFSEPPKNSPYDISIKLFKEMKKGKKPEEIASEIYEKIKDYIESYDVINGYMNIKLNFKRLIKDFNYIFDFSDIKKEKILIEHTSVNPNKALHIGHLRNSILGDSLYRLFELLGNKVTVLNYIDDTGSQVADVVLGFYYLGFPLNPKEFNIESVSKKIEEFLGVEMDKVKEIIVKRMKSLKELYGYEIPEKFDHYCGDFVYFIVNKLYEIYPKLEEYKKIVLKKIEEGNNDIYNLSRDIVRRVLIEQLKTLWKFDIYFDLLNKESDIIQQGLWEKTFKILKERGLIEYEEEGEKKGTYIIDLSRWKEFDGYEDKRKVLVRSNGTTVYLAKDIAYAFWKLNLIDDNFKYSEFIRQPNGKILYETNPDGKIINKKFNDCDISINVIGAEQAYLQLIIKKIIEELYPNKKYIHYKYNLVMLSKETAKIFGIEDKEIVKMSGRKGIYINTDNLLEKTIEISKRKLIERGVKENLDELAFKIARSTICFEILKYDPNSIVVFDIDKMTNIEEGNALYLMYTYARINSLLSKSGIKEEEIIEFGKDIKDLTEIERKLLIKIFSFKDLIYEVSKNLEINKLASYATDLARTFNEFYQNIPIIPKMKEYPHRLLLALLTKKVLERLFYILKIDPIEKI